MLGRGMIEGAALGAVCDIVPERARAFGDDYAVPWFADLDELLARDDVDVACVLTPSGLHHDHCLAAARAGKHVLVEKPMALRTDHADAMIAACEAAGVRLFVVKQCRFHVPVVRAREALDTGRFGKLVLGCARLWWRRDQAYYDKDEWRGTWSLDGGVLINQAIHQIDLLRWFLGPVRTVHAAARTALLNIEVEDTAVATIEFENGALGTIEATTATRPKGVEGSFSIIGAGGTASIGGMAADRLEHWAFSEKKSGDDEPMARFINPPGIEGYGHKTYYDHVVQDLHRGSNQAVDGREGRMSLEVVTALYESIELGRPVSPQDSTGPDRLGRGS